MRLRCDGSRRVSRGLLSCALPHCMGTVSAWIGEAVLHFSRSSALHAAGGSQNPPKALLASTLKKPANAATEDAVTTPLRAANHAGVS